MFWAFAAMVPVLISAWVGLSLMPSRRVSAFFLALSAGMLIALLAYDLVAEAFRVGGIGVTLCGFMGGLFSYIGANQIVAKIGVGRSAQPIAAASAISLLISRRSATSPWPWLSVLLWMGFQNR